MENKLAPDSKIDWSFPESNTRHSVHSIHPYPAKFIPEIPRELIRLYSPQDGTAVLDPFCGSGTTLVEAQKAGLESIGIDLNPVACLISKVKTNEPPTGIKKKAAEVLRLADQLTEVDEFDIPNVDHWFKEKIKRRLYQINLSIPLVGAEYKDALSLALSSIIVRVSNQDSDTRYAAIDKHITAQMLDELYLVSAARIEDHVDFTCWQQAPKAQVMERNILDVSPGDIDTPVGLVVTSPPYPNAYEYWLYHKYRMYWLGKDPKKVKEQEIGARAHYFKKNHATIDDFRYQMHKVFLLLNEVCVRGAKVCFVVGRSKIHNKIYDNADLIKQVALNEGFVYVNTFDRQLRSQRKSFNLSHAEIKKESIVVVEKA